MSTGGRVQAWAERGAPNSVPFGTEVRMTLTARGSILLSRKAALGQKYPQPPLRGRGKSIPETDTPAVGRRGRFGPHKRPSNAFKPIPLARSFLRHSGLAPNPRKFAR